MLTKGWTSGVLEHACHEVHHRKLSRPSLTGVLLKIPARLERMRLKRTGRHRERLRIERRPLDLRLELLYSRPQFSGSSHPQPFVVNHLVLGICDLDLFG